MPVEPGYKALYRSGELERRVESLEARLSDCDICPRNCGVNRLANWPGVCRTARLAAVSSVCAHNGEEPAISGSRGSGTIFFSDCNMRCVYCQNYQISQGSDQNVKETDAHALAESMIYLQDKLGCHNINLVSPSHVVPQIVRAVLEAVPMGLSIPLIYNTSSYDSVASLRALDGIIDIYLADLRYASDEWGRKLSGVPDYVPRARAAILEMYRQVGDLATDEEGIAVKGLIVRHLVLPNGLAGSRESLTWLVRKVSPVVTVSIMSQYYPAYRAFDIPLLARAISPAEYKEVTDLVEELEIENGWIQEAEASANYLPDFVRDGHPFEPSAESGNTTVNPTSFSS